MNQLLPATAARPFAMPGQPNAASSREPGYFLVFYAISLALPLAMLFYVPYQVYSWLQPAGEYTPWHQGVLIFMAVVSTFHWARTFLLYFLSFQQRDTGVNESPPELGRWPFVSIWIPAYNEAECIEAALQSLLELDYPRFEVLVINDGSTDDTLRLARRFEGDYGHCLLRVLDKPNGGKWSAHNLAFQRSHGELVLCLDADSRVDPNALRWLVARMADPRLDAVAGNVRVRNVGNFVTRCQALEYLVSNDILRIPMNWGGTVLIIPGPLGLFRRAALEEIYLRWGAIPRPLCAGEYEGPFECDSFAEDFDLSLAILALGGRIVYEPRAISYTRVPATLAQLINQRYRWCRGNIQAMVKFCRRAWHDAQLRQWRTLAWLGITYLPDHSLWLFTNTIGLLLVYTALAGLSGGSWVLLAQWLACLLLNFNNVLIFALKQRDPNKGALLAAVPFMEVYQGIMIGGAFFIALVDEIRGTRMHW